MNNSVLNDILNEYEKTRTKNSHNLELRKKELYSSNPRLQEIEDRISSLSINSVKSILKGNSKDTLKNLQTDLEKLKLEKENILKKLNLPKDYLKLKYDCATCKDTGYVFENGKTIMCNCLKQKIYDIEYNEKNGNIIKSDNFNNFNANLFSDKIDKTKYHSDISPRDNIEDIKNTAIKFIDNFDNESTKNLIFSGGTGLRKNFCFKLYNKCTFRKRKNCYVSNSSSNA